MTWARKAGWVAVLALRFLTAVVVSGLQTVRVIARASVGSRRAPAAAFVRVRFAPMSAQGAALLGCMVTLTPGTTTLDIDLARCELLLHVLDASDTDALVQGIRRDFEPALVALFGEERA
ncbi:Na+/H+ antiporter subunit E [Tepidimonas taiwanensis]|uniref:Multicomponent Na+:H+ antiporter n=1 Tax=Tepidimonas taiwanensis TaxID=307486 RepID=A0A554X6B2_9BURK|nr:Na+/H+ antiporter subunit E [Tepidimonas taiwanensis]MCX7691926.1 Na+/H+ antiporter subunit E [Tepidimonas taiwanensis]MDM7462275.1 Na+/H+ antiporter subunit E [Tepidimonas taiwanensis]TSE31375.1 multicomponent Na+:H+ antiporter [Tepidimonas taiwanensis]UBQ06110.1 Na+/H+ antiporter subunit E [Tepidimonas taiwanensis]